MILLLIITGCVYKADVRPTNQNPSIWMCEEAGIEIIIPNDEKESHDNWIEPLDPICKLSYNGKTVECDILFDYGNGLTLTLDENRILIGRCIYEADCFTVKVKSDTIFNDKYEKLVFVKVSDQIYN